VAFENNCVQINTDAHAFDCSHGNQGLLRNLVVMPCFLAVADLLIAVVNNLIFYTEGCGRQISMIFNSVWQ